MTVTVSFDVTEADRRAITRFLGYDGLASRGQSRAWARLQLRVALTVMAQAPPLSGAVCLGHCQIADVTSPVLIGGVIRE